MSNSAVVQKESRFDAIRLKVMYRPEHHQYDFHAARTKYPFRWLCTGTGGGKTHAAVMETLILATSVSPGAPGLIVVPDFGTYYDVVKPKIESLWPEELYEFRNVANRPAIVVFSPSGPTWIYIRSAHNRQNVDKINGLTVAWAYFEEAGRFYHGDLAWAYTLQRLRYDAPYNGVFVAASPRPGWLPKAFYVEDGLPIEAKKMGYSPMPDFYIRQAKTEWNTYNPKYYAERLRLALGEDSTFAKQELDGEIVSDVGLVYSDFAEGLHVIPHEVATGLAKNARSFIGGTDWGYTNPGASVWGAWVEDGSVFVVLGEWYKPRCHVEKHGAEVVASLPPNTMMYCDTNDPGKIDKWKYGFDYLGERYVINALPAVKDRENGIDSVRNLLPRRSGVDHIALGVPGAPSLYISARCTNLIKEFKTYRYETDASGQYASTPKREANTVGPDHALDALRYAIYSSKAKKEPTTSWHNL